MKYPATIVRFIFLGLFIYIIMSGKMMFWLGIFAISLIIGIFSARVYCGYVCPMNTLMLPTEWLSKKNKTKKQYRAKMARIWKNNLGLVDCICWNDDYLQKSSVN